MNDSSDFLDDALQQGLADANPYDPEVVAAHLPARSGELMLQEITSPKRRRSPLDRLFRAPSAGYPISGRAAFVGVLGVMAIAFVGLNIGLSRTGDSEIVEPADSVASTPDVADGSDPLVVDTTSPPSSSEPSESNPPTSNGADPESDQDTASENTVREETADSSPVSVVDSACVSIEVEDFELTGSWRLGYDSRVSGGAFVTWEGLEAEENNTAPIDVIEAQFTIETPGIYYFVWAMRQPFEVGDNSANSSWVNVPGAARFGPVDGGSYGGFVSVGGSAKGEFDWSATAVAGEVQSEVGVVFNSPGTYTVQLAGRSHGHEIDRIVLYHEVLSREDAITGSCRDA